MKTDYLSKENSACLKGLLAVVIIVAHWRNNVTFLHNTAIGMILTASGYLIVGMFLFLSGYGLRIQGNAYLEHFPKRRLLPYYATYLISVGIYSAIELVSGGTVTPTAILKSLFWYGTVVDFGWYLQAPLLLYLLYWFVYRRTDSPWNLLIIAAIYAILIFPMKSMLWYNSLLCFPLGIWWADHKQGIDRWLEKRWGLIFCAAFILFSATLLLGNLRLLMPSMMYIFKIISAGFFSVFVMVFMAKVPIKNSTTTFLGSISGEIYIAQGIGFRLFNSFMEQGQFWIQLFGVLTTSILIGMALHAIFEYTRTTLKSFLESAPLGRS